MKSIYALFLSIALSAGWGMDHWRLSQNTSDLTTGFHRMEKKYENLPVLEVPMLSYEYRSNLPPRPPEWKEIEALPDYAVGTLSQKSKAMWYWALLCLEYNKAVTQALTLQKTTQEKRMDLLIQALADTPIPSMDSHDTIVIQDPSVGSGSHSSILAQMQERQAQDIAELNAQMLNNRLKEQTEELQKQTDTIHQMASSADMNAMRARWQQESDDFSRTLDNQMNAIRLEPINSSSTIHPFSITTPSGTSHGTIYDY